MSPRARVILVVASIAATAAVVVVGATVLSRDKAESGLELRPGAPPLALDLGVRTDAESVDLRRAEKLYDDGRRREAREIFAVHDSVDARVGAALASWPAGSLERLRALAAERPRSALVRLHLGLVLIWTGKTAEAVAAWREALRVEPDSASALRAEDLLYPNFPRGRPVFVAGTTAALPVGSAAQQFGSLQRSARQEGAVGKLAYGIALQRLGRPLSARTQYDRAVAASPRSIEAKVAAGVVRFEKAHPERAFARLGPLSRRHPRSPVLRFHLGLLLLWIGDVDEAKRQLELATRYGPRSAAGMEAKRFLVRLENVRTETTER